MGALYAMAFVIGVSYKAVNIYCYFIFYPASFALFLKSRLKYLVLVFSLSFFFLPNFEGLSSAFFDQCVVFLNHCAKVYHSNYINMSIYLCVVVPLFLYTPFYLWRFGLKVFLKTILVISVLSLIYMIVIYPSFKPLLVTLLNLRQHLIILSFYCRVLCYFFTKFYQGFIICWYGI